MIHIVSVMSDMFNGRVILRLNKLAILATVLVFSVLHAQNPMQQYRLNGFVYDARTAEPLSGVNIYLEDKPFGAASDEDGYFFFDIPQGSHTVVVSYIGYKEIKQRIHITADKRQDFELESDLIEGETIVSVAERPDKNIVSTQMSVADIDVNTIRLTPVVLGESDLIKTIQLLPGVSTVNEGATGFNVRGGNFDQNLVLLDDAPILNP